MKPVLLIVLLSLSGVVQAEEALMRVFFSPAERAMIDQRIEQKQSDEQQAIAVTSKIIVKGYLKQDGKKPVVWVNDNNTLKSQKVLPDVRVRHVYDSGKVKMSIKGKGVVRAKPGQVVSRSLRGVKDMYEVNE